MTGSPDNPDSTAQSGSSQRDAARSQRPRDAATLIIVDQSGPPRILMGRRRPQQIFLPNKFVFPGGRADKIDRSVPAADELHDDDLAKLLLDMKGNPSPARARGLALAALRETYEEAGLLIGREAAEAAQGTSDRISASDLGAWEGFFGEAIAPSLSPLTFLARAITPPGRPRRYDTRFFIVNATHIAKTVQPPDDELRDLDWFTIEEARRLDLPNITRAIVEDLNEFMKLGSIGRSAPDWGVPFYFFKSGSFERLLLKP